MKCPNCSTENNTGIFCVNCGAALTPVPPTPPVPTPPQPRYVPPTPSITNEDQLPEQYKPLGAWAYFGLQLLFAIPLVGFIFLIVFSCSSGNINRRNFARSYWCSLLIVAVAAVVWLLLMLVLGVGLSSLN